MAVKSFILDTNALIESRDAIKIIRNGENGEANKIYIPYAVLEELDGLKKNAKIRPMVFEAFQQIQEYREHITILGERKKSKPDNMILDEINESEDLDINDENTIFVTNDVMLQIKAEIEGIHSQEFKDSKPFKSESQRYDGFVNIEEGDKFIPNSFYWQNGHLNFNGVDERHMVPDHTSWKIHPKSYYQNAAIDLMKNDNINLVTIQSRAGLGKSYISLATALQETFEKKKYKKIYIFKNIVNIGHELGFLPGSLEDKIEPYTRYMKSLLMKLSAIRKLSDKIMTPEGQINPKYIEILPLTFIRGMNIEDAFVIIDEAQNISRQEMRALLTRMCENVKVVAIGDTSQVDSIFLNEMNNGLNWVVKLFKGQKYYGHITLRGSKSRGPITDMVLDTGL